MKISNDKFVSLSYVLTVDGNVADSAAADAPLSFVFGTGQLLPKFEANIEGLEKGGKFAFTLDAADGYGEIMPEYVIDIPKNVFMVDGSIPEDLLIVGQVLPMTDNYGNRLLGTIKEIGEETVKMDFNHPMAGQVLNFEGEIVEVREATDDDYPQSGCQDCNCEEGECGDGKAEGGCSCGC